MLRRLPLLLLFAVPAVAQDAVVFPDGFTIRGKHGKETSGTAVLDSPLDMTFPCDFISSGPRWVYFSNNAKKNIQLIKNVKEEKVIEYRRPAVMGQAAPVIAPGSKLTVSGFNADGRRESVYSSGRGPSERIVQVVSHLSPKQIYLTSLTHKLRQAYHPQDAQFGPAVVRQLLATHPDLRDGWLPVPDPMKRVKIAEFLLECGWRQEAKAELDLAKKDCPWAWPKEAADKFDALSVAIDKAEVDFVLGELELVVGAGQYEVATTFLKTYQPKAADEAARVRLTKLKATVETIGPKYEAARRHLRAFIDELTVSDTQKATAAVGGGPVMLGVPGKPLPVEWQSVIPGAEAVLAELHPDSLERIETFTQVADQMARERAAGRAPKAKPQEALALAVTGWLLGKNGAKNEPVYAAKVWNTRAMVTAYLNERGYNGRAGILRKYTQGTDALGADEIAQIVSLLPPIDAEDLSKRRGKPIPEKVSGAPDTFKLTSSQTAEDSDGVPYFIRLPREYHHGRAYPLVVAIHDPGVEAAQMIGLLAAECERHGYVLIAPEWAPPFSGKNFDYLGKDHRIITTAIRDAARKFNIDPDRVFAFGFGQGANFALDLAMSRPDHFAGVIAMAPAPVHQFYKDYAKNAQKLAVYSVTGEWSIGTDGIRKLYQNWLPFGYYATLTVYKGRGADWHGMEVPTIFDWMAPKRRVRGLNSLRMDGNRFDAWHTFRETDDRFYWVGVSELQTANTLTAKKAERPDITPRAASFSADVVNGDTVVVKTDRGIKKLTVWLERGMIAWDKEVKFSIDGGTGMLKPVKVKPDLELMLEELYRTGDRKMLFFAKFEFKL